MNQSSFPFSFFLQSTPASPQPSPTVEIKGLVEAFKDFISGVSAAEVSWMIGGFVMVAILYWLSIIQLNQKETNWKTVLKWISLVCLWFILMVIFGYIRIVSGGSVAILLALVTAIMSLISVSLLSQRSNQWQRIFSGTIIIIIGSAVIITIAKGAQPYSYALVFGCLFGIKFGMLLISVLRIAKWLKTPNDDDFDDFDRGPSEI